MMNIKNIFVTTGISVLFGVYSIYNILEYLRLLNNERVKQIKNLQILGQETNKKYSELQIQYLELQKKYTELSIYCNKMKEDITILNDKIIQLQDKKNDYIKNNDIKNYTSSDYLTSLISLPIDIESSGNTVCDELCNFNSDIPRIHMETMNINYENVDSEFIDLLSLDNEIEQINKNKNDLFSRSRSTSVTEINWTTLTKKFLFG